MRSLLVAFVALALSQSAASQTRAGGPGAETPPATPFYAVAYVETMPSAARAAAAALADYRRSCGKDDGCLSIDLFEQLGRPGHWALVETWRDQKAFDGRAPGPPKQFLDALASIRVSGYDQRPYKATSVAAARGQTGPQSVSVVAHVDVAPNPAVAPMLTRLAEASRREPGNVRFDVYQHTMRGNHFTVVETWRDQTALDAHVTAPHTRQYRDELQPLTGSPLDERSYRPLP